MQFEPKASNPQSFILKLPLNHLAKLAKHLTTVIISISEIEGILFDLLIMDFSPAKRNIIVSEFCMTFLMSFQATRRKSMVITSSPRKF